MIIETKNEFVNIKMELFKSGRDLNIILTGGDTPHIGAVALAIYSNEEVVVNVMTVPNHKETDVAIKVSKIISKSLKTNVCVSCGIHIDNIKKDQIIKILELVDDLTIKLLEEIK